MANSTLECGVTKWKGRSAVRLANGAIALVALTGGGAIADLRLSKGPSETQQNVLWEAPWTTLDPGHYRPRLHNRRYGPEFVGKFLASFTGHILCLDYFGAPSEGEAKEGLCLHGEASVNCWKVARRSQSRSAASVLMEVNLPNAGLKFQRELRVRRDENVVYVTETVINLRATDHFFHWIQHVTLGPPFLQPGQSLVCLPAQRAITWRHGYEGKSLLANSKEFTWPNAPAEDGSVVDISRPFSCPGTGFVAAALLNPERDWAFMAALNFRFGLLLGYCLRREVFPWVAVWEENRARQGSPWEGRTQARGMEFGTTPMPVGRREAFTSGPLFGTPTFCCVPAKGRLKTSYAIFLTSVHPGWQGVLDIRPGKQEINLTGSNGERVSIPARDLEMTLR